MAIIYSYPNKATLVDADEILIIDSESTNPAKQTKHTSLSSLLTYVDNNLNYDLQQVLTAGATAYVPLVPGWDGQLRLGYNDGLGSNIDKVVINTSSASSYVLTLSGNVVQTGDYELKLNSSDFVLDGGALTAKTGNNTNIRSASGYDVVASPNGDFFVTTDADIRHESRDFIGIYNGTLDLRATTSANLSAISGVANIDGNTINISASTIAELKAGTNTLVVTDGSTNSTVNIGGTVAGNRADGVFVQAENFFQARTNTGQGQFYIIGGPLTPGTDSDFINSVHPHTFMDEIRLGGTPATFDEDGGVKLTPGTKGDAGTVGQLLSSRGSGASARWIDQDEIEPSQVVQLVTNKTGSTLDFGTVVSIDPTSPNQTVPDVIRADNQSGLPAVGVVNQSIPVGQEGYITKIGLMENILASNFVGPPSPTPGDVVYMAGGVGFQGRMTVARPTGASSSVQNIGIVTKNNSGGTSYNVQLVAIGRTNDLPNNEPDSLFTAQANGAPISTSGILEVDVANNTVLVGDTSFNTDVNINANILTANADNGIVIKNDNTGEITITSTANDVNISGTGSNANVSISSDKDVNINSLGSNVIIKGATVGKYLKVSKGSTGAAIPLGTAVYISGWSSGVALVEACNPNDLSTMPSIGVVTDDVSFGQGATGEIIISGSHEFASGIIIPSGNANDPLYVGTSGAITATRPTGNNIRQKVGRILNNGTTDEIYVNCVGILENESGTLSATIYEGSNAVTFNPAATSSGRWIYDGEIMSGFVKISVPPQLASQSFTNAFGVRFDITSGGSGNLLDVYPVNNNLPGKIDIVEAANWDPASSPYSGLIATSGATAVSTFQRPNAPDDYNLVNIPSWTVTTPDKVLTLRFSYRVN